VRIYLEQPCSNSVDSIWDKQQGQCRFQVGFAVVGAFKHRAQIARVCIGIQGVFREWILFKKVSERGDRRSHPDCRLDKPQPRRKDVPVSRRFSCIKSVAAFDDWPSAPLKTTPKSFGKNSFEHGN
jgi:uncharacterized membrane protein YuzA (DUF378 family)